MDPWTFWREVLNAPKLILAPMVDHSELPWRILSRNYGCNLVYTPMFHAANFANSRKYRQRYFTSCPEDRPLVVQFCANDPDILVNAASYAKDSCDVIDLNLGCPQEIARKGKYGAFLQDDWELISAMVSNLRKSLPDNVGVSCKIRRFDDIQRTVDYAKMLEKAGCSFIAVHGRTREQRGCRTGLADWSHIKAVKEAVSIPVIGNGNITSLRDAERCMEETGADAIMTAEGNLYNPALFLNKHLPAWQMANEYLNLVDKYPIAIGIAKSHIFKLFHRCIGMADNAQLRADLGDSRTLEQLRDVILKLRNIYSNDYCCDQGLEIMYQPVPPYLCQPRFSYMVSQVVTDTNKNGPISCDLIIDSPDHILNGAHKRLKLNE